MKKLLLVAAACAVLSTAGVAAAAGDPNAGREKSAACAACHGPDGNSFNPEWPKLAGQHADYLVQQLRDFQSGDRHDPMMSPMAMPLSEEDMLDLAAFYASQQLQIGDADPELVALGERIYRGGNLATGVAACAGCHAPTGVGNPAANFPMLGGQHARYTAKQLEDFKRNARANDPAQMMRHIAARMSSEEIEAVASYIQGLHSAQN
jgi:cytochrome c553